MINRTSTGVWRGVAGAGTVCTTEIKFTCGYKYPLNGLGGTGECALIEKFAASRQRDWQDRYHFRFDKIEFESLILRSIENKDN